MSLFECFETEGNEFAVELAKDGELAQIRASTVQDEKEVDHRGQKVEAKKHCIEWCAATTTYRCMRWVRDSKKMQNAHHKRGPTVVGELQTQAERWTKRIWEKMTWQRGVDPNGEALMWHRRCSGSARCVWNRS